MMFIEHVIGDLNVDSVPAAPITALIPIKKDDRFSLTIEGEQHSRFRATVEPGRHSFMFG